MRRREFIAGLAGAAAGLPLAAQTQQQALPVVGFVSGRSSNEATRLDAAFRKGLSETGVVDGQDVSVEYHWLGGQYSQLPSLMTELVRRRVAVIATPGGAPSTLAAKAATTTIPIVFGVAEDPVRLGLVASLARPGGNATGINYFGAELAAKQLGLLRALVPRAVRIAVLINPTNTANTESVLRDIQETARAIALQIQVLNAGTIAEIDAAFASLAANRTDALLVGPDAFFSIRRVQIAILAARYMIPTFCPNRDLVEAGGLMSYEADFGDSFRQVGIYVGRILKGEKPAELPVQQSTKFQHVINLSTARALSLEIPPTLLAIADEVIE
jgi:putative ABC transport system substrate-binding protein